MSSKPDLNGTMNVLRPKGSDYFQTFQHMPQDYIFNRKKHSSKPLKQLRMRNNLSLGYSELNNYSNNNYKSQKKSIGKSRSISQKLIYNNLKNEENLQIIKLNGLSSNILGMGEDVGFVTPNRKVSRNKYLPPIDSGRSLTRKPQTFTNSPARMCQKDQFEKSPSIKSAKYSLPLDVSDVMIPQGKLLRKYKISDKIQFERNQNLLKKLKLQQKGDFRNITLSNWAQNDYGINMGDATGLDESAFILKVRNQYISKKNKQTAIKLQSWWRMIQALMKYHQLITTKVGAIIRIQSLVRMIWTRREYLKKQKARKDPAALILQRYLKSFLVYKEWKDRINKLKMDQMIVHFRNIRIKMHTDSQIKIRYHWLKYKKRKAKKKAARKKRLAAEAAKKKRVRPNYNHAPPVEVARPVIPPPKIAKKISVQKPKTTSLTAPPLQKNNSQSSTNVMSQQKILDKLRLNLRAKLITRKKTAGIASGGIKLDKIDFKPASKSKATKAAENKIEKAGSADGVINIDVQAGGMLDETLLGTPQNDDQNQQNVTFVNGNYKQTTLIQEQYQPNVKDLFLNQIIEQSGEASVNPNSAAEIPKEEGDQQDEELDIQDSSDEEK